MSNPKGINQYTRSPGAIGRSQLLPKPKKGDVYARQKTNDRSVAAGALKWGAAGGSWEGGCPCKLWTVE